MSTAAQDPFYVFRDDLQSRVDQLNQRYRQAREMLGGANTASNGEFRRVTQKLRRELKHASRQLNDLEMTVRSVERDRDQFLHIDDQELQARKAFLSSIGDLLNRMTHDLEGGAIKEKLERDEEEALKLYRPQGTLGAINDVEMANTNYIQDQRARTQLTLKQQDDTLVELGESVDRVGLMADRIGGELTEQNRMLEEFEADLDRAAEEMGFMMGKLAKLLKTKDRCQIGIIIFLMLVMVVLGFMVFYT